MAKQGARGSSRQDPNKKPTKGIKETEASYQKRLDEWEAKQEQEVRDAYQEVLGREVDAGGLVNYLGSGLTGDELRASIASSDEGRRRGADPTVYGATVVDPETLSGKEREAYDTWRQYNPGQTYYSTDRQFMGWVTDSMSLTTYEAKERGLIQDVVQENKETGEDTIFTYVTPQANAFAAERGEELYFNGLKQGKMYYGDFSNVRTDNIAFQDDPNAEGMQFGQGLGSPKEGFFGEVSGFLEDLGMSEDLASTLTTVGSFAINPALGVVSLAQFGDEVLGIKESYFLTDPLNVTTAAFYGREGFERNIEGGAGLLGVDEARFAEVQGVAGGVATGILGVINPLAGAALSAVQTYGNYQRGMMTERGMMTASQALASGVVSAGASILGMNVTNWLSKAALASVGGALSADIMGKDSDDALRAGLAAGAGSAAGSVIGSFTQGFAPQTGFGRFATGVTKELSSAAVKAEVSGSSLDTKGWIATAATAVATSSYSASQNATPSTPANRGFSLSRGFNRTWEAISSLPDFNPSQAAIDRNTVQMRQYQQNFGEGVRRATPFLNPLGYAAGRAGSWIANSNLGEATINRLESYAGGASRGFTRAWNYATSRFQED